MSRLHLENQFVNHACQLLDIDKAPIDTFIQETYAQCNEDIIIDGVLRAQLTRAGRDMKLLRYIEIGANHPVQTSSTYLLHKLYGATGVLVDADPALAATLRKIRTQDQIINSAITTSHAPTVSFYIHEKNELSSVSREHIGRFANHGGVDKIARQIECPNIHINEFMRNHAAPYIDYFVIDIEGLDFEVLNAMDPIFQPTLIQCEHSGQAGKFIPMLAARGYNLLAMTDVNLIFIRNHVL